MADQTQATLVDRNRAVTTALTAEDVGRLIDNGITAAMTTYDKREQFIRSKMGDMPEMYRKQMPISGDEKELAAAEQTLRAEWRREWGILAQTAADKGHLDAQLYSPEAIAAAQAAKGQPAKAEDMSYRDLAASRLAGVTSIASPPTAKVDSIDTSKMSVQELFELGLKTAR